MKSNFHFFGLIGGGGGGGQKCLLMHVPLCDKAMVICVSMVHNKKILGFWPRIAKHSFTNKTIEPRQRNTK